MLNSILRTSQAVTSAQAVALREVRKVYGRGDGSVVALDGVTVGLARGSFTALMGPSGSGKSTFLNVAAGRFRSANCQRRPRARMPVPGPNQGSASKRWLVRLLAKSGWLRRSSVCYCNRPQGSLPAGGVTTALDELQSSAHALRSLLLLAGAALRVDAVVWLLSARRSTRA